MAFLLLLAMVGLSQLAEAQNRVVIAVSKPSTAKGRCCTTLLSSSLARGSSGGALQFVNVRSDRMRALSIVHTSE